MSDDAKDSVDLVRGLRRVAGRRSPQSTHAQPDPRPSGPDGRHRLLHRRPLLPPPDLTNYLARTPPPGNCNQIRFAAAKSCKSSRGFPLNQSHDRFTNEHRLLSKPGITHRLLKQLVIKVNSHSHRYLFILNASALTSTGCPIFARSHRAKVGI